MYIPIQGQPNFENKIYYADNYSIYIYDISTLSHRKLIEYSKKIDEKKVCLLKFDIKDMVTKVIFFLLIETEFHRNSLLIVASVIKLLHMAMCALLRRCDKTSLK